MNFYDDIRYIMHLPLLSSPMTYTKEAREMGQVEAAWVNASQSSWRS